MQALLLSALLAGPAHAVAWSDLAGSFPPLPCQDGWAGCVVDGTALNADMRPDSQGVPMPADLRLDWFTLEGTPALSPFVPLSSYGQRVAEAAEPAPEPAGEPPGEEEVVAAAGPPPEPPTAPGAPDFTAPPASTRATQPGTPPATSERTPTSAPASTGTAAPPAASTSGGMRPGFTFTGNLPGQSTPPATATSTPTGGRTATAATTATPVAAVPAAPAAPATCDDLVALEPAAMMGQLSGGQRSCLEDRVASAGKQTEKDKVSRVLLADAEARGDKSSWARLMKRHLEEIDRSDPDLCFKYAIYLSRLDVGRANGVIRWSDYALENKSRWQGATYISRVFALLKLKAEAANRIWQAAEEAYVKDRSDENEAKATKYRNMTKEYARAWLDYAKVSSQDTKNAMALCVSAAGNRAFCEGG